MGFFKQLWPFADQKEEFSPQVYSAEDRDGINTYMKRSLGNVEQVFHELVSPDIHVDIVQMSSPGEPSFYKLSTMGAGAYRMNVPESPDSRALERAEYMIHLPANWQLWDEAEEWYWPIRWMKILSRFPLQENIWLGPYHSIPAGEPFAENTGFCCILLLPVVIEEGEQHAIYKMHDGSPVNFYRMIPLYEEEMNFKIKNGTEALLELLDEEVLSGPLDVSRRNYCA